TCTSRCSNGPGCTWTRSPTARERSMSSSRCDVVPALRRVAAVAAAVLLSAAAVRAARPEALVADAAEQMDRARVRALLQRRADVNTPQVDGMTALHWAVYHDDVDLARLLLQAGANARVASRYEVTPLGLACTNGNGAIVELLLQAGADPNAALPGGETALM